MSVDASFHPLAERELNDAALYYENESPGLGDRFLEDVLQCVEAIRRHPASGAPVRGEIRRRLCRRFPYALHYRVRDHHIRVLAVSNLKRRPFYWTDRS